MVRSDCASCGAFEHCLNPYQVPSGEGKKKILIVGKAPDFLDDKNDSQLAGRESNYMRVALKKFGVDLDTDCWKTNAVICKLKTKKISVKQINVCRQNLVNTIERLKPEKIFVLGSEALQSLIGKKISVTGIERWTGTAIPDQEYKTWIYPLYTPAFVKLQTYDDEKVIVRLFNQQLKQAIEHNERFPIYNFENRVNIIYDVKEATALLKNIRIHGWTFSFDYETTGIKPYKDGHEIVCMSIGLREKTYAFPMFKDEIFRQELKKLLTNLDSKKIAHNLKFEDLWTNVILKHPVNNWHRDTMVAAHILDNRKKTNGLKHQGYILFGIAGYDKEIEKFIKSESKNTNDFNDIKNAPEDKLLLYCGMDSAITMELYIKQKALMTDRLERAYELFHETLLAFCPIERNGIHIDEETLQNNYIMLSRKLARALRIIKESKEAKMFDKEEFNFNSTQQLGHLLYDILGFPVTKKTKTDGRSTDAETLEKVDIPFTNEILTYKKISKMRDTYLAGFMRETVNGVMHPFFNLHTVSSYRTSSSAPNFQNIPVRDTVAQMMIRSNIVPSKGRQLVEFDFSSLEVIIGCCYHQDPNMIAYINDPTSDMHLDTAKELFLMTDDQIRKKVERFAAKNGFVFAEFYGDYYKNCAKNIWFGGLIDKKTKDHLAKHGIKTYAKFEKHVKGVEEAFWGSRFKVYDKWRDATWKHYIKTGNLHLKTGFTCTGRYRRNQATNLQIQGSASHCLLWCLTEAQNKIKCDSDIIGQIHDSMLWDMVPSELEYVKKQLAQVMTVDLREHFKWIIVPISVDMSVYPINGSWTESIYEEKI